MAAPTNKAEGTSKEVFWNADQIVLIGAGSAAIGVVDTELPAAAALADATANPTTPLAGTALELFNGTTWDRVRNNHEVTVFASAARPSGANNSADITNHNARGVALVLDVTAVAGTSPTLDVKLQRKCTLSGKYVDIVGAAFAQKTGTGTDELTVYPGIAETANESVSDVIPRLWRAVATVGGTDTPLVTFTLSANYVN